MLQGLVKKAWQSAKEAVTIDNTHSLTSWLLPLGQFPSVGSGTVSPLYCPSVLGCQGFDRMPSPQRQRLTAGLLLEWAPKSAEGSVLPKELGNLEHFFLPPFMEGLIYQHLQEISTCICGLYHMYKPHMIKGIRVNLEPVLRTFTSIYGSKHH